jgi:ABC-2 type transport system permease protein
VLAIIGFGLFLSALCQTQQQAVLSTFIFMTPAILLSGFAAPIENMPNWLQVITYANPTRYFMTLSRGLFMKNLSLEFVLNQIWPMAIIASIMLFSSTIFFRRKLN